MSNILVVVAHPDDEVLGMGGSIVRQVLQGDDVHVLIVGGWCSPYTRHMPVWKDLEKRARQANNVLGSQVEVFGYPDQLLDTLQLIKLTQRIEDAISKINPSDVYTHYRNDVNRDHNIVSEAVMVATRPYPGQCVASVFMFETPSSTEWNFTNDRFCPNVFIELDDDMFDKKIAALHCYGSEMRPTPHPRSFDAIRHQMAYRGSQAGFDHAEAFQIARACIGVQK